MMFHSVLIKKYKCSHSTFCPLFNNIVPVFSLPVSSPSALNCSLDNYLGKVVMMLYMSKSGMLSTFHE